ncbi:hypothetical protein V2G26_009282 [Clonostachys chloroleuca]
MFAVHTRPQQTQCLTDALENHFDWGSESHTRMNQKGDSIPATPAIHALRRELASTRIRNNVIVLQLAFTRIPKRKNAPLLTGPGKPGKPGSMSFWVRAEIISVGDVSGLRPYLSHSRSSRIPGLHRQIA